MVDLEFVWVFVCESHAGGVFSTVEKAESWIAKHSLTGLLTRYPLDQGAYDWAVENDLFHPKRDEHRTSRFIGSFVSGSMKHHHYENGARSA